MEVGRFSATGSCVAIFRGTETVVNWIYDLDAFFTPYEKCDDCEGAEVLAL